MQAKAELGEGPVWDDVYEKLYWIDIMNGLLIEYDPLNKSAENHAIGGHIGAAVLRQKGGMVLAKENGFVFYNLATQQFTPITDPEAHLPGNRFNDGKCDPAGRFWAGTMAYSQTKGAGNLYCLHTDLKAELKLQHITISNGLTWNSANDTFYYIDTPERSVVSFDYDHQTSAISCQKTIRQIAPNEGYPDGMAIDDEDHLWVALYGGSKVIRINPSTGDTVFEVTLPVPKPTSCTFGGRYLNELFITTCREQMSATELEQAPMSGSLFKAKVPFIGLPANRFKG